MIVPGWPKKLKSKHTLIFSDNTLVIMKYCDTLWFQTYNSYYSCPIPTLFLIQGLSVGTTNTLNLPTYHLQVQQMLDALQLPQYKEAFAREEVDGEVLLELDDQVLQCELGINFKIHRIRLMKLISGATSAKKLTS